MSRSVEAGRGHIVIGLKNRIKQGAKPIQSDLDGISKRFTRMGAGAIGLSAAVLAPLGAITSSFASTGDQIDKMSARTGVAVETLSGMGFAAEQTGTDVETLEKGFFGLSRSFFDLKRGSKLAVESFDAVGLSVDDLDGLSAEQQMMKVADGLAAIQDESVRGAVAQQIFGRAGRQLLPLLSSGSKGIKELTDEAAELGRVLTEEDATAAAEYTDAMNRVKSVASGLTTQIGAALAPTMTDLADLVSSSTQGVVSFVKENRQVIQVVAAAAVGIGVFGGTLVGVGGLVAAASVGLGGIATAASLILSPMGLAIGAAAGLGYAIVKYTSLGSDAIDFLEERFGPLLDSVQSAASGIMEALKVGDIEKAWDIATSMMELTWLDLTDGIYDAWSSVMSYIQDRGLDVAAGLGQAFQGLAGMLQGLLDKYKSYYDKVHGAIVEKVTSAGGVRTVGGQSGSAFEDSFGNLASNLEDKINSIRQFGENMESSAESRRGQGSSERDRARLEREARKEELRASMEVVGKAAEESARQREVNEGSENAFKSLKDFFTLDVTPTFEMPGRDKELKALQGIESNTAKRHEGTFSGIGAMLQALGATSVSSGFATSIATEPAEKGVGGSSFGLIRGLIGDGLTSYQQGTFDLGDFAGQAADVMGNVSLANLAFPTLFPSSLTSKPEESDPVHAENYQRAEEINASTEDAIVRSEHASQMMSKGSVDAGGFSSKDSEALERIAVATEKSLRQKGGGGWAS